MDDRKRTVEEEKKENIFVNVKKKERKFSLSHWKCMDRISKAMVRFRFYFLHSDWKHAVLGEYPLMRKKIKEGKLAHLRWDLYIKLRPFYMDLKRRRNVLSSGMSIRIFTQFFFAHLWNFDPLAENLALTLRWLGFSLVEKFWPCGIAPSGLTRSCRAPWFSGIPLLFFFLFGTYEFTCSGWNWH